MLNQWYEMHCKLLAKTMHDVSNDLVLSSLKDLFVPILRKSILTIHEPEIKRKSFSRIGAKLWNEIPTKSRALPKAIFKKIQVILLKILQNEDSCKEFIISKVKLSFTLRSCTSFLSSNPVLS